MIDLQFKNLVNSVNNKIVLTMLILLCGCTNTLDWKKNETQDIPEGFELRKIDLQDPLGNLYLILPKEMNRFLNWYDVSDCPCCSFLTYRYIKYDQQPIMESGFVKEPEPDSMYQISIRHTRMDCIDLSNELIEMGRDSINTYLNSVITYKISDYPAQVVFKDSFLADRKEFYMVGYIHENLSYLRSNSQIQYVNKVEGATIAENKIIRVEAICESMDCNGFLDKMRKTFMSVRYERNN